MNFKKLTLLFFILFSVTQVSADDHNHQFNFFIGNFDFSDDKQAAVLVGLQHQNENLVRDTIIGNISPITGGFITENSAVYVYTGFEWNVDMGTLSFTPSFAPGLYHEGDGKDLGHILEFKSEIQFSYELSKDASIGLSYNHISNASLGDKNPGANSYMFNFLKNF
ncbi:acyloxyacyl hydrolase [Candidatus Pelagibacter sp.]|nr:acyloxyacyl hydrolase [Candidatus Pelagibacter sp.]